MQNSIPVGGYRHREGGDCITVGGQGVGHGGGNLIKKGEGTMSAVLCTPIPLKGKQIIWGFILCSVV